LLDVRDRIMQAVVNQPGAGQVAVKDAVRAANCNVNTNADRRDDECLPAACWPRAVLLPVIAGAACLPCTACCNIL